MGVQLCQHFCFSWREEGGSKYHLNRAIIGPPVKRHWNDVSLVVRWWSNNECWLGSLVIFRGSGLVLLRNPIALWFLRGRSGRPVPQPLWFRTRITLGRYMKIWYFVKKIPFWTVLDALSRVLTESNSSWTNANTRICQVIEWVIESYFKIIYR